MAGDCVGGGDCDGKATFDVHLQWKKDIADGKLIGPRLIVATAFVDGKPPLHPGSMVVSTPEEAREAVRYAKRRGIDFIKVTIPGFDLHDELAIMVEGGLTPLEALQTATINPAKYLNMLNSFGTVEKGRLADLVLLEANPLDDINNTRRISAVVVDGRYLSKAVLEKMLADVEATAAAR